MALGDSGGRSSGNRTGDGARRRNTQRERAFIDPPLDQLTLADPPKSRLTPRGESLLAMFAWGSWVFFSVLLAVVLCSWWGLL